MALGARPAEVLRWVVTQGFRLAAAGLPIGLIAGFRLNAFWSQPVVRHQGS